MPKLTLPSWTRNKWVWLGLALVALVAWTALCHIQWLHGDPTLHGVPAFFLGVGVEIILFALARTVLGTIRGGWRWLFTRAALRAPLWSMLFFISVLVLFYSVERWRGKRAWAAVVREAKQLGEPLSPDALARAPVPDDQNFARAPLFAPLLSEKVENNSVEAQRWEAIERVERHTVHDLPLAVWLNQTNTNLRACLKVYYKHQAGAPTSEVQAAEALVKEFQAFDSTLEQVRSASTRPYCQWPMDLRRPWLLDVPQRRAVLSLVHILRYRASAELALAKQEAAFADIQLALRLLGAGWQKPPQASPWLPLYDQNLEGLLDAIQPLWEGLCAHAWNAEQLAKLQQQFESLPVLENYPAAVRSDALTMATLVETLVPTSGRAAAPDWDVSPEDEFGLNLARWFYPVGWSLQDQAAIHQFHFESTALLVDPATKRLNPMQRISPKPLFASSDPLFPVFMTPRIRQMAQESRELFPLAQSAVDQAMLACALERFRLDQGHYPDATAELVPKYVSKLPADVINGQSLKYIRLEDQRFLLYSVGLNMSDDHAQPPPRSLDWRGRPQRRPEWEKGDWVWLYPTSK